MIQSHHHNWFPLAGNLLCVVEGWVGGWAEFKHTTRPWHLEGGDSTCFIFKCTLTQRTRSAKNKESSKSLIVVSISLCKLMLLAPGNNLMHFIWLVNVGGVLVYYFLLYIAWNNYSRNVFWANSLPLHFYLFSLKIKECYSFSTAPSMMWSIGWHYRFMIQLIRL